MGTKSPKKPSELSVTAITDVDPTDVDLPESAEKDQLKDKHKKLIDDMMVAKVEGLNDAANLKFMNEQVSTKYGEMTPHVNGYYYIHMVSGPWVDTLSEKKDEDTKLIDNYTYNNSDLSNFVKGFKRINRQFGQLATDIDIPQLNIEYESVSGKNRNLNYASKVHFAGDFSINFLENFNNDVFRYHESWFKYIDALKKGFIKMPIKKKDDNFNGQDFIEVPYFNAVWVAVYAPFTTNIRLLIKIMGVAPINLPFKQIIGDRGKNQLTTINQSYKSNDMVYKFFEDEEDQKSSDFFAEFMADITAMREAKQ